MFLTDRDFREHHGNAAPVMIWLNLNSKEEVDELYLAVHEQMPQVAARETAAGLARAAPGRAARPPGVCPRFGRSTPAARERIALAAVGASAGRSRTGRCRRDRGPGRAACRRPSDERPAGSMIGEVVQEGPHLPAAARRRRARRWHSRRSRFRPALQTHPPQRDVQAALNDAVQGLVVRGQCGGLATAHPCDGTAVRNDGTLRSAERKQPAYIGRRPRCPASPRAAGIRRSAMMMSAPSWFWTAIEHLRREADDARRRCANGR